MDFTLVTEDQLPPHVRAKLAARDRREWEQQQRRRARNARRRAAYDQARDDAAEIEPTR